MEILNLSNKKHCEIVLGKLKTEIVPMLRAGKYSTLEDIMRSVGLSYVCRGTEARMVVRVLEGYGCERAQKRIGKSVYHVWVYKHRHGRQFDAERATKSKEAEGAGRFLTEAMKKPFATTYRLQDEILPRLAAGENMTVQEICHAITVYYDRKTSYFISGRLRALMCDRKSVRIGMQVVQAWYMPDKVREQYWLAASKAENDFIDSMIDKGV